MDHSAFKVPGLLACTYNGGLLCLAQLNAFKHREENATFSKQLLICDLFTLKVHRKPCSQVDKETVFVVRPKIM